MKEITFGTYKSYEDFSLILTGKTIPLPTVKTSYVDIMGASGRLDLTEYFGEVSYSNRKLSFKFETKLRGQEFYEKFEEIANAIHGERLPIYLEEDQYFYFDGRINVHEYKSNEKVGSIVIEADCEPFKLESYQTEYLIDLTSTNKEYALANLKMRVTPTIEISGSATISFDGKSYALTKGTYTIPELVLNEGDNFITMQGSGQVRIIYTRGKL